MTLDEVEKVACPDYPGPLVGFRIWNFDRSRSERPLLHSIYNGAIWTPYAAFEAACGQNARHGSGGCPDFHCGCGIYGFRSFNELEHEFSRGLYNDGQVIGQVALWGRVVDHDKGWRAQFAYPLSLSVRLAADTYGVEYRPNYHRSRYDIAYDGEYFRRVGRWEP